MKLYHPQLSNISKKAIIGNNTVIHAGCHIHDEVKIGDHCQIQAQAFIPNGVTIEDDVFVGPQVVFTNDPSLDVPRGSWKPTPTLICEGAKIGANATVRAGVTVGRNAIVGMGLVVLCDIPAGETWVGNPARKIVKVV